LVGIRDHAMPPGEAESLMRELRGLCNTLALEIVGQEIVNMRENHVRYVLGTGKAEELSQQAAALEADCLIFDRDLSPSQQRNWETLTGLSVFDRQELIIQIFASRAQSREAELQVSLAELIHALPRLQHKYIDLSRQRGGRYGTRGSGETFLETDRRRLEQRIHKLKDELEEVKVQRQVQRKQRERKGLPVCALVGYTNAGKSSLLNALTGAEALAEDKLFATLDSTSRRLELPQGTRVLLIDTVGFIRRLPHSLVNAFRSTLEELSLSKVILNVLDASSPDIDEQYKTTLSVLKDLGADGIPMICLLNKIDLLSESEAEDLKDRYPDAMTVSAQKGWGLEELGQKIEGELGRANQWFQFPLERSDLAALVHRSGQVISEEYNDTCIRIEARVDERTAGKLKEFQALD